MHFEFAISGDDRDATNVRLVLCLPAFTVDGDDRLGTVKEFRDIARESVY